jgi:hypothetical protein
VYGLFFQIRIHNAELEHKLGVKALKQAGKEDALRGLASRFDPLSVDTSDLRETDTYITSWYYQSNADRALVVALAKVHTTQHHMSNNAACYRHERIP